MIEAGVLAQTQGDLSAAQTWYTLALDVARAIEDRGRESSLLNNLGAAALEHGDLEEAEHHFTDGLLLAEALGDQRRRANALANLGATAHYRGDVELALQRYLECLQIWRKVGDARGIADMLLNVLLLLAPFPAERRRARAAGEESLRLFRELGEAQVRRSPSPDSASLPPGKAIWNSPRRSTPKASNWHSASRIWPPKPGPWAIWP